jgi:hypothetical protein
MKKQKYIAPAIEILTMENESAFLTISVTYDSNNNASQSARGKDFDEYIDE